MRRNLRSAMKEVLAGEPLAETQYVSCADYDTLEELENERENPALDGGIHREDKADR